jgi:hypothetical protein
VPEVQGFMRAFETGVARMNHIDASANSANAAFIVAACNFVRSAEFAALVANDARWRAVLNCARLRALGSAGIEKPNAEGYAHLGLEMWTHYDAPTEPIAQEWLTKFADACVALDTARKDTPCGKESGDADTRND